MNIKSHARALKQEPVVNVPSPSPTPSDEEEKAQKMETIFVVVEQSEPRWPMEAVTVEFVLAKSEDVSNPWLEVVPGFGGDAPEAAETEQGGMS